MDHGRACGIRRGTMAVWCMRETMEKPEARHGTRLWRYVPFGLILAGLVAFYAMGWHSYLTLSQLAESRETLRALVSAHPLFAPLAFVAVYAVTVACSFPAAAILTVFSGFLFGWLLGGIVALAGATIGATILFLAARSAFGDALRARVGSVAARLSEGFRRNAFAYMLVLRIAPFIPFVIVNIAPALAGVRLRTFVSATLIGMVPATFAYAWLGRGIDSVLEQAAASGRKVGLRDLVTPEITIALAALALVAALAVGVRSVWSRRRAQTDRTDPSAPPVVGTSRGD